jgi:hypothetical protein
MKGIAVLRAEKCFQFDSAGESWATLACQTEEGRDPLSISCLHFVSASLLAVVRAVAPTFKASALKITRMCNASDGKLGRFYLSHKFPQERRLIILSPDEVKRYWEV